MHGMKNIQLALLPIIVLRTIQTFIIIIIIYLFLTTIGLTPGGSSTVHIYTQTEHRIQRTEHT
jgi:hypothetical protein